jgi:hypothetical protein
MCRDSVSRATPQFASGFRGPALLSETPADNVAQFAAFDPAGQ